MQEAVKPWGAEAVSVRSESQFAAAVDALAADPASSGELTNLLREDHPVYDQRGTATTVRMRGWVLLALSRAGVSDAALVFVLEELDTGDDAYLTAAAARALRHYPKPEAAFAPFVLRALDNIRYRDEPVSFGGYGEYATSNTDTSPVRELLATLSWLGPQARGVLREVEALREGGGALPKRLLADVDRAINAIRGGGRAAASAADVCCVLPAGTGGMASWARGSRRGCSPVQKTIFEDQDGASATFGELFRGHPTVVAFFYTRCDNPLKCSLTVTKLGRVQKLLEERGLAEQIHTAAITYDPAFDLPDRLRRYGRERGLRADTCHRLLRASEGMDALRAHFKLGVNFIASLVNRHRIEVYILDAEGRAAASFVRLHWDEGQVVQRAVEVLREERGGATAGALPEPPPTQGARRGASTTFGALASVGVAFFPKCPICWAAYLSMFGVAGLGQIPYSPWLQPLLVAVMLVNLASVWLRGRAAGQMGAFYLAGAGALAITLSKTTAGLEKAAVAGVLLTLAGSLLSTLRSKPVKLTEVGTESAGP